MQCPWCFGKLVKSGKFKTKSETIQRYKCRKCGRTCRGNRILKGITIPKETVIQILNLFTEGMGVRACSRLTGCDTKTVTKILLAAGARCDQIHDRFARKLNVKSLQLDEIWGRVFCKQTKSDGAIDRGDQYTFIGLDASTRFIVAHHTGKRDRDNARVFLKDLKKRIEGSVQFNTDAWRGYLETVNDVIRTGDSFATVHKQFKMKFVPNGNRRYPSPTCSGIKTRARKGKPNAADIATCYVERQNLSLRHYNRRFTRLTLGYSRKLLNHRRSVSLFVFVHNFCRVHGSLGQTPAQAIGLTENKWGMEELLNEPQKTQATGNRGNAA